MMYLKKEELSSIIYQLIAVFISFGAWYDKAIFARNRVYITEKFFTYPDLECVLPLSFAGQNGTVYVYRAPSPYTDYTGRKQLLTINLGTGDYLTLYSYSPYVDVLEALQAVVKPYKMYFEFDNSWILYLTE